MPKTKRSQPPPCAPGDTLDVSPHGLGVGGEGVARVGAFVLFIPFGVPGDRLTVRVEEVAKRHGRARIAAIPAPSPDRVSPPCPVFGRCGGCQLQQMSYPAQLAAKEALLADLLAHHARFVPGRVRPILGAGDPWHYRNKMQLAVGPDETLGLYAPRSHRVVPMPDCLIQHPANNRVLARLRDVLPNLGIAPYDESQGTGDLRHILVKVGERGNAVLVTLVASRSPFPGEEPLVRALADLAPLVRGVTVNINPDRTNRVLGRETVHRWGEPAIEEEVDGIRFRVGATSFFQVHTEQIARFYDTLSGWLPPDPNGEVFDAYAGVGTFSLWLARRFGRVTHLESSPEAVSMAAENGRLNQLHNLTFHVEPVETGLLRLAGRSWSAGLVDPPRQGLSGEVRRHLLAVSPERLVYISCNPATLVRDLNDLVTRYEIREIQPVDLFPHTGHLEIMAFLSRKFTNI